MDPVPRPSSTSLELVLGLPRAAVPGGLGWHGIRPTGIEALLDAVDASGGYRVRSEVEDDPEFQQLIPYVLVSDGGRLFLMRRLRAGADTRLHDRYSIGVGGHIGVGDGGLEGGLRREWSEELVTGWAPVFQPLGLLNDDTDRVGAVHLGVVYRVDAAGRSVAIRETHKLEGRFAAIDEVAALGDRLETWSRLCLSYLMDGVRA